MADPNNPVPILYGCPVCGKQYETMVEAIECRDQPQGDSPEIGDIVVVPGAFRCWGMNPSDPWVAFIRPPNPESSDHFEHPGQAIPYFVVTAKHGDRDNLHRTLVTLSRVFMDTANEWSIESGWNPGNGDGHHDMWNVTQQRWHNETHDGGHNDYWSKKFQDQLDKCVPCAILQEEAAALAALGISSDHLM